MWAEILFISLSLSLSGDEYEMCLLLSGGEGGLQNSLKSSTGDSFEWNNSNLIAIKMNWCARCQAVSRDKPELGWVPFWVDFGTDDPLG